MSLFTNGKARESRAEVHRGQPVSLNDDFVDMSGSDLDSLGDLETQNHIVQKNPSVFTGSLSITAPPDAVQKQGKLSVRKTLRQDQSVRPPGFPNRSEAPAGDFRPNSAAAAAAINDEPGEALGQPEPTQIQIQIPTSQTTSNPSTSVRLWVNHSRSLGSRPASARRGQIIRPTLSVAPSRRIQTMKVALKKKMRKMRTVDAEFKKICRALSNITPEDNDAGGVSEDPACVDLARQRFYLASMMTRTLMMIVEFAQK
ncbi:hypothetical protein OJAV_G00102680 [Oryzias javanicus]|uniref:Uncharacterized protein n=1 Tax=Oryzias javanicus TaxID=123683 RepID=A0A437CXW2_ORYJA|nr:hypothetical protein OJAV_G00102680 [Oryzias javanicus]